MVHPSFGAHVDWNDVLDKLLDTTPPLSGIQLDLFLREEYAVTYGIEDLGPSAPPLALASTTPIDGNRELWSKYRRYSDYELYDIKEAYGLSLKEFLTFTRADVEWMIERQRQRIKTQEEMKGKVEREMERKTNG